MERKMNYFNNKDNAEWMSLMMVVTVGSIEFEMNKQFQ